MSIYRIPDTYSTFVSVLVLIWCFVIYIHQSNYSSFVGPQTTLLIYAFHLFAIIALITVVLLDKRRKRWLKQIENTKVKPPFTKVLPSFYTNALIMSYYGTDYEVNQLLTSLSKDSCLYTISHGDLLSQFLSTWQPNYSTIRVFGEVTGFLPTMTEIQKLLPTVRHRTTKLCAIKLTYHIYRRELLDI